MVLSLALWLTLAGRELAEPPTPAERRLDGFRADVIERMTKQQLEINKSRRVFLEEMIETYERDMKDSTLFPAAFADRIRDELPRWRAQVQFMKDVQRELEWWLKQRKAKPSRETDFEAIVRLEKLCEERNAWQKAWDEGRIAPMPREVK